MIYNVVSVNIKIINKVFELKFSRSPEWCSPYESRKILALPKRRESWSSERVEAYVFVHSGFEGLKIISAGKDGDLFVWDYSFEGLPSIIILFNYKYFICYFSLVQLIIRLDIKKFILLLYQLFMWLARYNNRTNFL